MWQLFCTHGLRYVLYSKNLHFLEYGDYFLCYHMHKRFQSVYWIEKTDSIFWRQMSLKLTISGNTGSLWWVSARWKVNILGNISCEWSIASFGTGYYKIFEGLWQIERLANERTQFWMLWKESDGYESGILTYWQSVAIIVLALTTGPRHCLK